MAAPVTKDWSFFNKFQTDFFTNPEEFANYSTYDIKEYSVTLLTNLYKGFPHLADEIINLYNPYFKAIHSPALLIAVQRVKFCNGFTRARVPQFIYFAQSKKKAKVAEEKTEKIPKGIVEFSVDVRIEIMNILQYDIKTYQYLKNTERVQFIGKQVMGEILMKEEARILKAGKKK
jgi:hypothetical protein